MQIWIPQTGSSKTRQIDAHHTPFWSNCIITKHAINYVRILQGSRSLYITELITDIFFSSERSRSLFFKFVKPSLHIKYRKNSMIFYIIKITNGQIIHGHSKSPCILLILQFPHFGKYYLWKALTFEAQEDMQLESETDSATFGADETKTMRSTSISSHECVLDFWFQGQIKTIHVCRS